jgi:cold shock CspA family protein|tara:strand:- start:94 stop:483 length:390 start_codon:yes stop_codon:yes gene_type:complete
VDDSEQEDGIKKKFRIQRRRLGKIMFIEKEGTYGFIQAEDFTDDVFFHSVDWDGRVTKNGITRKINPEVELWVEFELDDEHRETQDRLRAKVVRPTSRPTGGKLSGRDATFRIVTHHPHARRKKPTWRK